MGITALRLRKSSRVDVLKSRVRAPRRRSPHRFASRTRVFRPRRRGRRRGRYSPLFFVALVVTVVSSISFVAILSTALMAS